MKFQIMVKYEIDKLNYRILSIDRVSCDLYYKITLKLVIY